MSPLDEAAQALPLFPLPRIVLMPRDLLPLHVFEPRYRALVADVLAGDRLLGMATLKPGFEHDYEKTPPLYDQVGIGEVVKHQLLPDGRSNLVVQWRARGTIVEEIRSGKPYRVCRVAVRAEASSTSPMSRRAVARARGLPSMRQLVVQLGAYSLESSREAVRIASLPDDELVDYLARRVLDSPEQRLQYVAYDDVAARAALVEDRLAELIATGGPPVGEA